MVDGGGLRSLSDDVIASAVPSLIGAAKDALSLKDQDSALMLDGHDEESSSFSSSIRKVESEATLPQETTQWSLDAETSSLTVEVAEDGKAQASAGITSALAATTGAGVGIGSLGDAECVSLEVILVYLGWGVFGKVARQRQE